MQRAATTPQPDPAAVLAKATARASELLGLTGVALARTIGLSEPTVSRILMLIAVLVSVSTALVGPVTFFGLLVANLLDPLDGLPGRLPQLSRLAALAVRERDDAGAAAGDHDGARGRARRSPFPFP